MPSQADSECVSQSSAVFSFPTRRFIMGPHVSTVYRTTQSRVVNIICSVKSSNGKEYISSGAFVWKHSFQLRLPLIHTLQAFRDTGSPSPRSNSTERLHCAVKHGQALAQQFSFPCLKVSSRDSKPSGTFFPPYIFYKATCFKKKKKKAFIHTALRIP